MKDMYYKKIGKYEGEYLASSVMLAVSAINVFVALGIIIWRINISEMDNKALVSMAIDFVGTGICCIFTKACHDDPIAADKAKTAIVKCFFVASFVFLTDFGAWAFDGFNKPFAIAVSYVANSFLFIANILLIYAYAWYFSLIISEKLSWIDKFLKFIIIYLCFVVVMLLLNLKYGFIFFIDEGVYARGPVCGLFSVVPIMLSLWVMIYLVRVDMEKIEKQSMFLFILLPVAFAVCQTMVYGFSFTATGLCFSLCIMYSGGHIRRGLLIQNQEAELTRQSTTIMLSQMQPHFLYNALTSVACLCEIDPLKARDLTKSFAKYLRGNLNALKSETVVPFTQELDHIKNYLDVELVRFQNKLQVIYDIQVKDFELPALAVQPMVENAVKHGVTMRDNGGTVVLRTRETEDEYIITVEDDGVGFDMKEINWKDGTHVGVANVRDRLKSLSNGILKIESEKGKGTTATILIPKIKSE